ncbi:MAG: hypothetical protein QW220_02745 [Candidatus Bathyarchaeia archaeon]
MAKRTGAKIDDALRPIVNKMGKIFIIVATPSIRTFHIDVKAPLAGVGIANVIISLF